MEEHRAKTNINEHGAIIMEATIALTTFMFAMYMLLSVIQMAYTQERIAVTLDATTKEMAEYAHVCFASEGDAIFTGTGGKSSSVANEISEVLTTIGSKLGNSTLTEAGSALKAGHTADSAILIPAN